MLNLITDRTASDVSYIDRLLKKGMQNWTADERLYFFNGSGGYEAVSTLTDEIATLTDTVAVYVGDGVVRGAYNYTDLNRVTAAMDGIKARLEADGYRVDGYKSTATGLPYGYIPIEWIGSDGTQYINTGFLPNQNSRVVIDVTITQPDSGNKWLFGCRETSDSGRFSAYINSSSSFVFGHGAAYGTVTQFVDGERYTVDRNKNTCTVAGVTKTATNPVEFQNTRPLYLFAENSVGVVSGLSTIKVHSCKIYGEGVLVRDFIPCTNSEGAAGLYDMVQGKFYANAGTGVFAAGDEQAVEIDRYVWSDSDAPRAAQLEAYLANVAAIRAVLDVLPTTPETPEDMDLLTWMEENNIEQILVDVETVAQSMRKIYRRSNQVAFYSGFGLWFANS